MYLFGLAWEFWTCVACPVQTEVEAKRVADKGSAPVSQKDKDKDKRSRTRNLTVASTDAGGAGMPAPTPTPMSMGSGAGAGAGAASKQAAGTRGLALFLVHVDSDQPTLEPGGAPVHCLPMHCPTLVVCVVMICVGCLPCRSIPGGW